MCSKIQIIVNIIAFLLRVLQWGIPIVLIVLVTFDVVKIIINTDEKAKSDTTSKIVKRIIYAVICFLVPMLVRFVFSILDSGNPNDYGSGNSYDDSWVSCFNNAFNTY